jgi:hypothetical protein
MQPSCACSRHGTGWLLQQFSSSNPETTRFSEKQHGRCVPIPQVIVAGIVQALFNVGKSDHKEASSQSSILLH